MELSDNISPDSGQPTVVLTTHLRDKIRDYSRTQREKSRANASDALRFGLGEIKSKIQELDNLTAKDVSGVAGRIKRRKHATVEDMYRLSHAFLQDIDNIRTFAKIPGAVQVLVKEFTGHDDARKLGAAECLCNFSLGEAPVAEKIASLAGSYFVTYLDCSETLLKRTCLWTIANLLATGGKGAQILLKMALVPKLWSFYTAADEEAIDQQDFRHDAGICLQLIAEQHKQLLSTEDRSFLAQNITMKNPGSTGGEFHLQIVFYAVFDVREESELLQELHVPYLINYALSNIENAEDFELPSNRLRVLFAVRVLANIFVIREEALKCLEQQLNCELGLVNVLNKLFAFQNQILNLEIFWLLKNILLLVPQIKDNVLKNLQIPDGTDMSATSEAMEV